MNIPLDAVGRQLKKGQTVVRAQARSGGYSAILEVKTVTRVEDGKVYLDNSKVPMKFTQYLAIVPKSK